MDAQHTIAPCAFPERDRSGEFGRRVLRLLALQVDRNLDDLGERGPGVRMETLAPPEPRYLHYFLGTNALALAVLARADAWDGLTPDELTETAAACLRALVETHPLAGGEEPWHRFSMGRFLYLLATSAVLLEDVLDEATSEAAARVLAEEADRFLDRPAPAQLRDDTQAESNAWHGGGLAAVACALPHHAHRDAWEEKALEYTISAYATAEDVASERIVDRRALREWLTGPNALADHTVENHGFVHPDYMVSISEMARTALLYALVGRPLPEGLTFNAGQVFHRLAMLTLPDTSHLYVQGTDYTARRIDGFWQACLIALMEPTPLRTALLWRSLERLERMAQEWPALPMHAWLGMPHDLGCTWGLTQNYLAARLFGVSDDRLPAAEIEERLAGTHVSDDGQFLVQRTRRSITSVAWHSDENRAHVLGLSMPLDLDTLCYPMQGSWFGDVVGADDPEGAPSLGPCTLHSRDGAEITISLERCGGRVLQHCTFTPLPEGGIFLSELEALEDVIFASVTLGTIWLFDDLRWTWQDEPRIFLGAPGKLSEGEHVTRWVNVDDRLGWTVLGADRCIVQRVPGHPAIFRKDVPMYDTVRVEFLPEDLPGRALQAGERCCRFMMAIRPGLSAAETEALAGEMNWPA